MSTTWLDRTIGWLSPQRGARRLAARAAMEALAGYEGARLGRRTQGWVTTSTSADASGELDWTLLRDRARDLVRNNPHAARAVEVMVSHTIGTGITAEVKNRRVEPLWADFVEGCDADGDHDLNGLLAQIERCRMESGECLVRFLRTGDYMRTPVPTQLRVLEPEYLDESRDYTGGDRGRDIRHGIERDMDGRVLGYWLFPEHPGERVTAGRIAGRGLVSEFVPAADVIHVFRKQRPGQTRGITDFAPVMLRMRDLDDYDDAEIMRKKIEACLVGVLTTNQGLEASAIGPQSDNDDGINTNERMRPGTWYRARVGESVTFNTPQGSAGYADFKKQNQRDVAAGLGIPYELLTGDMSQTNYSSLRGRLIDFRKRIEAMQWLLYVPRVCRRIEERFREDLLQVRSGLGVRTAFEWTPPKFELMDPLKENQADLEAVLAGFVPLSEVQRQRGWSQEEILQAIAETLEKLDAMGLGSILKSDPRTQVKSTATPKEPNAADEPDEEAA